MCKEMIARWIHQCEESDVGLWWIADDLREANPTVSDENDVRQPAVPMIRTLLATEQVRAATLLPEGKYALWEGNIDDQVTRIDHEWAALGRSPNIGDIVWFVGPRDPAKQQT